MKYTQIYKEIFRKAAALGWKPDGSNITNRFADLDNLRLAATAAGGGAVGYTLGKMITRGKQPNVEKLPDFDPLTGAYIGKSYLVPDTLEEMQKLHKKITGEQWKVSAPKIFLWLLSKRKDRIRNAIRTAIKEKKGDLKGLSHGEIASLVFPYVYKKDGSVAKNLGAWRWREYPVKGAFKARPISAQDIEEYLDKQKKK